MSRKRSPEREAVSYSEYRSIHNWIRNSYGRANRCESGECEGISSTFDWALLKGKKYGKDRNSFFMLCRPCHVKYDKEMSETPRLCGHRLYERHFIIIRQFARKWKCSEAEALRIIIDGCGKINFPKENEIRE